MRRFATSAFDRLDVGDIAETGYLGLPDTLALFSPLLKSQEQNPHATLLTCFHRAVHEARHDLGDRYKNDKGVIMGLVTKLKNFLPETFICEGDEQQMTSGGGGNAPTAKFFTKTWATKLVRDYDALFGYYMSVMGFEAVATEAWCVMKGRNTVVREWPMRFRGSDGEGGDKGAFERAMVGKWRGGERWVEWVRDEEGVGWKLGKGGKQGEAGKGGKGGEGELAKSWEKGKEGVVRVAEEQGKKVGESSKKKKEGKGKEKESREVCSDWW